MDLEAMQLLNLSPIPELSEIELSTMLDHLSGLSDINGDLTDRNVEDIIKEAEDLLDRSISSKTNDSRDIKSSQDEEKKSDVISENVNSLKENEKSIIQQSNSIVIKQHNNAVNDLHNTSTENESSKHFNSPVENTSVKVYSPGGTTNHIKSTIDSLKEFSTFVEKKLSSQSQNPSPKGNTKVKQNEKSNENSQITLADSPPKEKLIKKKPSSNNSKTAKPQYITGTTEALDKSIRLLNCFERLYQVKPARLVTNKRAKVTDKTPKTITKKKLTTDFKNLKKNNWQGKTVVEKIVDDTKNTKSCHRPPLPNFIEDDFLITQTKTSLKGLLSSDQNYSQINTGNKTTDSYITQSCGIFQQNYGQVQSRIDEKLILRVLEEMEEIKDQVRKVGVIADVQNPGRPTDDGVADLRKGEAKSTTESANGSGIKRLERQFSVLKEKYDHQMEKLEAENCRLREALNGQEKIFREEMNENSEVSRSEEMRFFAESKSLSSSSSCRTDKKITRSMSLDNCRAPRNSPCSSLEKVEKGAAVKEAFCQTEEDAGKTCREVGTEAEIFPEARTENKENVTQRKRPGKWKPFSDVNVHQTGRQKKMDEHESQLLATLRGLQAEVTARDKENRKLKSEMESLRKQMRKLTAGPKTENWRKCHAGTQTIGLGSIVQKAYVPENYEAPEEFEKENEDLRSRIKALEEDFELLKEKRISDLQALHQVHEEEMAKLVSKLETQSALTRHLHSLLVNR